MTEADTQTLAIASLIGGVWASAHALDALYEFVADLFTSRTIVYQREREFGTHRVVWYYNDDGTGIEATFFRDGRILPLYRRFRYERRGGHYIEL